MIAHQAFSKRRGGMLKRVVITVVAVAEMFGHGQVARAQTADPHTVPLAQDSDFLPAGKSYDVDFGDQKFRLDFKSARQMVFTSPDGKNTADVEITTTRVGDGIYMIYWSRRAGQHVVHVDDFKNGVAYTNIFLPDGTASRRRGTLVEIK
jgi:phosphoribosylpyrophosphate synthetase